MAKRRSKNSRLANSQDKISLYCSMPKFKVQEDRKKAVAVFSYERTTAEGSRELNVEMAVFAIWMDEESGNAIKAFCFANPGNPQHRSLVSDLKKVGRMNCGQGFCLTTDGTFIRYGKVPRDKYVAYNQDSSHSLFIYDSKSKALAGILEQVSKGQQTIGGLNLISLNRIPDSVLKEIGYVEIPDLMRKQGVPMWKGSPDQVLPSVWSEDGEKSRKQFLDLLGKTINV